MPSPRVGQARGAPFRARKVGLVPPVLLEKDKTQQERVLSWNRSRCDRAPQLSILPGR